MWRLRFWLFLSCVVGCLVWAPRATAGTLQELAAKTNPSVVLLTVSDAAGRTLGKGTGFFVSPDGRIVTNHHVIEGGVKVTATLKDGRKLEAEGLVADDEDHDLAIIKVPGDAHPALPLGQSRTLRQGDEIVVIGSPLGLSGTLSTGIVSAIRDERSLEAEALEGNEPAGKHDRLFKGWGIQVTAAISPGSSGSPIMSLSGEVVAVAVGRFTGGESVNFGIPVEEAKALLDRAGAGAKVKAFATTANSGVRTNLMISAGFFGAIALIIFGVKRYDRRKERAAAAPIRRPPPS